MAIAFDTAIDGGNNSGGGTSLTFSHTCTGSNRYLVLCIWGDLSGNPDNLSGATYNGVAMTIVASTNVTGGRWVYIAVLPAPASGANNIVITTSSTSYIGGLSSSYTGCIQTGPVDSSATSNNGAATSLTTSSTSVTNNCWGVLAGYCNILIAAGTNATARAINSGTFSNAGIFDTNAALTPAGAFSMQIVSGGGVPTAISAAMVSIAPFGAAPPATTRTLAILGAG